MDRQAIFQTLEIIVKERSGLRSAVPPDARFKEDLEIDSLLVVDIVIDIEKRFGISLPDAEIASVSTLNTATALIVRLLAESATLHRTDGQKLTEPRLLGGVHDLAQPAE